MIVGDLAVLMRLLAWFLLPLSWFCMFAVCFLISFGPDDKSWLQFLEKFKQALDHA